MSTKNYTSKVLSSTGKGLYLENDTADVYFVFETGGADSQNTDSENAEPDRVPAHKLLLCAVSEVFRAMFSGTWKEKHEVPIVDATAAGFKEFLQFFYLEKVHLTNENVQEVMNLGKMYLVDDCVTICSQFLQENLSAENVCMAHAVATLFDINELKRLCEQYISINCSTVITSPSFLKCDQKMVGRILKLDTLSSPELEVFEACMNWVKAASEQDTLTKETIRTHLGDSFYDIRFGSMSMDVFASIFDSYPMTSIFTTDEHKDIVQMITTDTYKPKYFNKNRRDDIETEILKCNLVFYRFDQLNERAYYIKEREVTTFTSNANLLLRDIKCTYLVNHCKRKYFEPIGDDLESHLTIVEIRKIDDKEVSRILYDDDQFKFDGDYDDNSDSYSAISTHIFLPKPIIIIRGLKYQIIFEQHVDDQCTDTACVNKVAIGSGIVIKFHDDKESGVIESLNFSQI